MAPLLLLLHGYGANEEDLLGLASHLDARLVCVSARAPYALDFGGFAWFNIEIGAEGVRFDFAEAAEPLAQIWSLVDALRRVHRPARIFIAGFSQGASMALAAALKRPRDFVWGHCVERGVQSGYGARGCGVGTGPEGFYVARAL